MRPRGKITAMQAQKAHPDRVSLFVDDEYVLGIRRELVYHLGLRVGLPVTPEDLETWQREEMRMSACDLAVKYISHRARSRQQVLDYLSKKEFSEEIGEQALRYLESLGYLNDQQFAADFVHSRVHSKPRGKRMIRWELQQKGIPKETIEQALTVYGDELEAARRLLAKKSTYRRSDDSKANKQTELKIARFLAGKGFSGSTIQAVIKEWREA